MWRKTACAVGGLVFACAAAYFATSIKSDANPVSFDLRWLYPSEKQDRLASTAIANPQQRVVAFNVPSEQTTVVTKTVRFNAPVSKASDRIYADTRSVVPLRPVPDNAVPASTRDLPHDAKRNDRLPEGCEPSFSPVTTPALARVAGRCVS